MQERLINNFFVVLNGIEREKDGLDFINRAMNHACIECVDFEGDIFKDSRTQKLSKTYQDYIAGYYYG